MITPPALSNSSSTVVPFDTKSDNFAPAHGLKKGTDSPEVDQNQLSEADSAKIRSIQQRAQILLSVDHKFDGVLTTDSGDRLEFSSQLSFELSHEREFEILAQENQKAIEEAYGLRKPENSDEDVSDDGLTGARRLDEMVPKFANSENTSQRIFDFAKSMLGFFLASADREGNNELTEENLKEFTEMMRKSIDEGFRQAEDIIQGLSLMNEDLDGLIALTYDKTHEKLNAFEEETLRQIREGDQEPKPLQQLGENPTGGQISSSYKMSSSYEAETNIEFAA